MNEKLLKQYAEMAVKIGINIQKGQTLVIKAPIHGAEFARLCAEVGYACGAKEVVVYYNDEKLSRIQMQHTPQEVLCDIKPYQIGMMMDHLNTSGGAAFLSITSRDPEIYKGLDTEKIDQANIAYAKALVDFRDYTMNSRVQWSIVAIPSPAWAKKVFPDLSEQESIEKLWETIFKVSRVNGDPVQNWKAYTEAQMKRRQRLNELKLTSLHLTAHNGTDVHIGLASDCIWAGGLDYTTGGKPNTVKGVPFIANMPTEELFTAPDRNRVDGIVYGTKPYVYNGNLIEDFMVRFEKGKVVAFDAKSGKELLGQLLQSDEGACHIGEIALVPASSPINQENILFYNTLFDENAACHIAFGEAYPDTIEGGDRLTPAQLLEKGVNVSVIHEDVMIGTADMDIVGLTKDGEKVQIFAKGEWVF